MAKNERTAAIVDGILRFTITSGAIATGLVLPNLLVALDKPLDKFAKKLDKRARERELRQVAIYMRSQNLIKGDFEQGILITERGRRRLAKIELASLKVRQPTRWSCEWHILLYDIPEEMKTERDALTKKLRAMGFHQLQRSAWLHPFPCRAPIQKIAQAYGLEPYLTYLKTSQIDGQASLLKFFRRQYPETKF